MYQNLREATAPPCRGAGPTGLRGFTPTCPLIKYAFVDVRPLRRFAPPPLQGGGVLPSDGPIAPDFKPGQLGLGRYPTTHGFGRMSPPRMVQVSFCRIWADFRGTAFELARQNREKKLLLSAKIIQTIIYVSAVSINRRCGYIFEKVSPRQSNRDGSGGVSFASAIILDQSFSGFSKKV